MSSKKPSPDKTVPDQALRRDLQLLAFCTFAEHLLGCISEISRQLSDMEQHIRHLILTQEVNTEIIKAKVLSPGEYDKIYRACLGMDGPLQ